MNFSKDGSKFLFATRNGLIEVLDFNRCSGQFSNAKVIHQESQTGDYPYYWGGAFSPNQNLIYVSSSTDTSRIYQFNLMAPNIWNSRDTIYQLIYPTQSGGQLRLAPNDKIYWSCWWENGFSNPYPYPDSMRNVYNENISVINQPNNLGSACDFQPYSFYLGGKRTYIGLPNNPDYEMGSWSGSPCDTLTSTNPISNFQFPISIYPNPTSPNQPLTFTYPSTPSPKQLTLYNVNGAEVGRYDVPSHSNRMEVKLPELAKGLYVARLVGEGESAVAKFVVAGPDN